MSRVIEWIACAAFAIFIAAIAAHDSLGSWHG